jgi:endonuclease/exonuclease/phosphatase (EEP) superfamily protein YafD
MTHRHGARRVRRVIGIGCWVFGLGCAAWLAFGFLWRHDPADQSPLGGWLAFAALLSRAFAFHLGVVVALGAAAAVLARARRASVLLALLLVPTLGSRAVTYAAPRGAAVSDGPGITMFSANLLFGRGRMEDLLSQIEREDPDVILLQEYTPGSSAYGALLRERYPHRVVLPREDAFGQAVFSRLPFARDPEVWHGPEGSTIPMIACEVVVGGRRIGVWNVHTLPPLGWRGTVEQRAMVAWIGRAVERVMASDDAPDGLVIAGDFNAPYRTNHLRELRGAGLREAHDGAGVGPGATWPRLWWKRHFPGIRLDHAMYGGGLEAAWARVGEDFGSDHRPVVARFVLTPE